MFFSCTHSWETPRASPLNLQNKTTDDQRTQQLLVVVRNIVDVCSLLAPYLSAFKPYKYYNWHFYRLDYFKKINTQIGYLLGCTYLYELQSLVFGCTVSVKLSELL